MGTRINDQASARAGNALFSLSEELEMLVREDVHLKKIAGAAALVISRLGGKPPPGMPEGHAMLLAQFINEVPDDTLYEALQLIRS